MMTFATGTRRNNLRAFTLIELILVMTMMVIVLAVVFPSLKGFFHGRSLSSEAGQFLSLTRYGQSRAISEGLPVELWIDQKRERYGLNSVAGYTESQTNATTYEVDKDVQITVSQPPSILTRSNYWTQASAYSGALTKIRFQPDGFISDNSPENIYFTQPDSGAQVTLAVNSTHMRYEFQTNQTTRR